RWATWASDGKQIGKARYREAKVRPRALSPLILQSIPASSADVDGRQRPCHCVEPSREDDRVELVLFTRDLEAFRRDFLDRCFTDIDQAHVRPVESLPIARIDAQSLAADDVAWRERLGDFGVTHRLANLATHELRGCIVRRVIQQQI